MAKLRSEFRSLKKTIGQTSTRDSDFYVDCIIQCLDLITKFDIRKPFEKYIKANEHLLKKIVNLFNIHKLMFDKKCGMFLIEVLYGRLSFRKKKLFRKKNRRIFRVICKYIHMENNDHHLSLQLINLFLIVVNHSGFYGTQKDFIDENFSYFFLDLLMMGDKEFNYANYLIYVFRRMYEPINIYTDVIINLSANIIENSLFIIHILDYIGNYIFETTNMFLRLAETREMAILNRDILDKSLNNCIRFLHFFDIISRAYSGNEKLFGECILSTDDLCHLYEQIFNCKPTFILRFKYICSQIFTDRQLVFNCVSSLAHGR